MTYGTVGYYTFLSPVDAANVFDSIVRLSMSITDQIRLSRAFVYPIKSFRGVPVDALTIHRGRVVGDRLWMLVNSAGHFMHQRDYPRMATVDVRVTTDGVELRSAGLGPLVLSGTLPDGGRVEHVRVWRRAAPVVGVGAEADAWLTSALGTACRLLRFADGEAALDVPDSERNSSLQDATPIHLTSDSSLADLNRRIGYSIPMNRFRPNIAVAGAPPYDEDTWKEVRIGTHTLRWIRPCTRCVMTTTDHTTGVRQDKEPLRTLATYRRLASEVVFGHYLTIDSLSGSLNVGDEVRPAAS